MGVTAFKSLTNFTSVEVLIRDKENGSTRTISPADAAGFDYWIPWCTSQSEFPRHHIEIEVPAGTLRFFIWQSADADGDFVRFSTDNQYHGRNDGLTGTAGEHVPGVAEVDGNRLIIVRPNPTTDEANPYAFEVQKSG